MSTFDNGRHATEIATETIWFKEEPMDQSAIDQPTIKTEAESIRDGTDRTSSQYRDDIVQQIQQASMVFVGLGTDMLSSCTRNGETNAHTIRSDQQCESSGPALDIRDQEIKTEDLTNESTSSNQQARDETDVGSGTPMVNDQVIKIENVTEPQLNGQQPSVNPVSGSETEAQFNNVHAIKTEKDDTETLNDQRQSEASMAATETDMDVDRPIKTERDDSEAPNDHLDAFETDVVSPSGQSIKAEEIDGNQQSSINVQSTRVMPLMNGEVKREPITDEETNQTCDQGSDPISKQGLAPEQNYPLNGQDSTETLTVTRQALAPEDILDAGSQHPGRSNEQASSNEPGSEITYELVELPVEKQEDPIAEEDISEEIADFEATLDPVTGIISNELVEYDEPEDDSDPDYVPDEIVELEPTGDPEAGTIKGAPKAGTTNTTPTPTVVSRMYNCNDCSYGTRFKSNLKAHVSSVHRKIKTFRCAVCGYRAEQQCYIERHMKKVHPKAFACSDCDHVASSKRELNRHIEQHHRGKGGKAEKRASPSRPHGKDGDQMEFQCKLCDHRAPSRKEASEHRKSAHYQQAPNSPSQSQDAQPHHQQQQQIFSCPECDLKSSHKHDIERHLKAVHYQQKEYKCGLCDFRTAYQSSLCSHDRAVHRNVKTFACHLCDYRASGGARLRLHIKGIHLKQRDLKCPQCDYTTTQTCNLKTHARTVHGTDKNFACSECDFKTAYKHVVERHMEKVHWNVAEFACELCEFKSNRKYRIAEHTKKVHLKVKGKKKKDNVLKHVALNSE